MKRWLRGLLLLAVIGSESAWAADEVAAPEPSPTPSQESDGAQAFPTQIPPPAADAKKIDETPHSAYVVPPIEPTRRKRLAVGAGVLLYNTGRYSTEVSGAPHLGAVVLSELVATARFDLPRAGWGFSPLLALTPQGRKSPEGGSTSRVVRLEARGTRTLWDRAELQAGLGFVVSWMSGSGGTIQLNNGTRTSTFGLPDRSSWGYLFAWEAGAGVEIFRGLRVDASVFMTGPLSSRRALSYAAGLSYGVLTR